MTTLWLGHLAINYLTMPSNNPRVLIRLEYIGEEGEREVLRPVAPVSL